MNIFNGAPKCASLTTIAYESSGYSDENSLAKNWLDGKIGEKSQSLKYLLNTTGWKKICMAINMQNGQ